ncbi:MAG: adenosylmethionine decarboxylase [Desulfurococcales archaeon]|nr:adenosylmethionine decarboxylase [Desulfurococcales archaeon]
MVKLERRQEENYRVIGRHIYGNLIGCPSELLADEGYLRDLVVEAAEKGNMTLLDVKTWKIGMGVSVVAVILESHITIHTWPEYGYATLDVYSCGSHTDPYKAFRYIVSKLKPKKVVMGKADRSLQ